MNKILLALTLMGAGAGAFHSARQSTTQLQQEANATGAAWLAQTQLVAAAESEHSGLIEHVRELTLALRQAPTVEENKLWSALQTNRAGSLTPELRERLLEELGFNWQSSTDFIVVSKETVRDIHLKVIKDEGELTDVATTVLAMTPGEREQVEAAMQHAQTEFKDWASSHIERTEPKDDVVAQYTLAGDPTMSISNNFATAVFDALGRERAELIMPSARNWMSSIGIYRETVTMIVKRYLVGNKQQLSFQLLSLSSTGGPYPLEGPLPSGFLCIFPNGWADVAKREGFELPQKSQDK